MAEPAPKTKAAVAASARVKQRASLPASKAKELKAVPTSAEPATRARKPRRRSPTLTGVRRPEIVKAAVKLFSRRGFEATRAEDIAQAAKIAKGTLYLYFRSKEAIYSAAIAHAVQEVQALASERIGAATGFRDKISTAIAVRLHFWEDHESLYRLLLTLGREPRHRRQTNNLLQSGQAHLLAIFDEGEKAGELPPGDYHFLAWAVLDMIRGTTERRMDRLHCRQVEADAEAITAFVLRSAELLSP